FGKRLKVLRKNKNMTQEELANALNISFQAISKWENEISNPDLSLIVPLAAVLGVSTDTLLGAFEQQDISRQEELIKELKRSPIGPKTDGHKSWKLP
ncbi:MAG: helix-turn-helix transcriptional regulator, partial [Clostridia bacterium]|nr:helix-turn-helix transcriptional regulator [Clostridia bacterium]